MSTRAFVFVIAGRVASTRTATQQHNSMVFAGKPPGTSERKCVNGASSDFGLMPMAIQPGELVIGGQVRAGRPASAGGTSKVWHP